MKRLLAVATVIGFAIALSTSGCKDSSSNPSPSPSPYVLDTTLAIWPLKVGNSVSFRELELSASGSLLALIPYGPFFVERDSVVGGNHWYLDRALNAWMWNGLGGVWLKFPLFTPGFDTTSNLFLKWPCKKNDTYNTRMYGRNVSVTVDAVDEIVTVPAVAETCVVYTFRSSDALMGRIYLAPGIGYLREDDYFAQSTMTYPDFGSLTSYVHYRYETTGYVRN